MTRRSAILVTAISALSVNAVAQDEKKRASPHETVSVDVGGNKVSISYGRPYLKGRAAFTGPFTPNGQVWRLGADEATKMTLSADATMAGTLSVPKGSYALFAIPGAESWTIIVNKTADQWGAFNYDKAQDLGRFDVPVKQLSSAVEQFTITLTKQGGDTALLKMAWQKTSVETPIKFA